MNVKEYLSQAYNLHQEIQHKKAKIATLRELATDTSSKLSDMPRAASPDPQHIEEVLANVIDLEREIAEDETRLGAARCQVANLIANVPNAVQIQILAKRYLEFECWNDIGAAMKKTARWAQIQHKIAILWLEKKFHSVFATISH